MQPAPTPDNAPPPRYRIADLEVDLGKVEITRGGEKIALPKLSFDLLCALINAAPAVVTNDELLTQVWPGLMVSPESVAQRVKLLRDAIGDDSQQPKYILGVRGRGYRLIPVPERLIESPLPTNGAKRSPIMTSSATLPGGPTPETPALKRSSRRPKRVVIAAVVVIGLSAAIALGIHFWTARGVQALPAIADKSIAVLPFVDMSEKNDQEYFADGMAEEILDLLVQVPGLKVIGRTSSFQFKGQSQDLRAIGEKLGVAYLLEGSVRKSGDHLRVTAQLINSKDGTHLWSETYNRDLSDVLKMQDEIASNVARALQIEVGFRAYIASRAALRNPEAYTLYLQGLRSYQRFDLKGIEQAIRHFQRALELDPSFAEAAVMLAAVYQFSGTRGVMPPAVAVEKARNAVALALRLDPNVRVHVHTLLAILDFSYDWDWAGAEREIHLALADPNNANAFELAAILALIMGRADDALESSNTALALDPLNGPFYFDLGFVQLRRGRPAEAEAAMRRAIEIIPAFIFGHYNLGQVLLARGEPEVALAELQKEAHDGARFAGSAMAYFALNRLPESDAALAQVLKIAATVPPHGIAGIYAFRGESDEAFKWLDLAYVQKDPLLFRIKYATEFDNLHGDPRWKAFLKKMNLPD
jgi:TolB-like protein/DNA-binding winged helix-turn-helix (wHTH) protein/Tfp pilus assembly protein PilF